MIIALEGIDASGKATQKKRLAEALAKQFDKIEVYDFPHYESTSGEVIGRVLRGETLIVPASRCVYEDGGPVPVDVMKAEWCRDKAIIIQGMLVVDRLEVLPLLDKYAVDKHKLLILDRYNDSGKAYGLADGLDATWLDTIMVSLPVASLTVLLDISVEESMRRRPTRRDYYEKNLEKLKSVRSHYRDLVIKNYQNHVIIDGEQSEEEVTKAILEEIVERFTHLRRFTGLLSS